MNEIPKATLALAKARRQAYLNSLPRVDRAVAKTKIEIYLTLCANQHDRGCLQIVCEMFHLGPLRTL